ncbi:Yip1 family protein [Halalkalibacter sp. APA_J-10(15)]|uniref:Yip1 family protein n=1 Tax=Halalkalibacter sp. APA_J-10(15) TaxID=2933805 RepID=UPI0027953546|nr:Yip1 family protein [Halalkalibacter sp. APA_J-10(15)]
MLRNELIRYPIYLCIHPFKGYWDVKYEGKGRLNIALTILLMLTVAIIIKRQYAGFIVNFNNPNELNSLDELVFIVLPFFIWCVANWSITTLMDGEGKFKEIIIVTAYALVPMILIYLFTTMMSQVITLEEAVFYFFLDGVATIWFIYLLFVGIMTVHQYTATKTIVTIFLTVMVMGILIFLGLLSFSLFQQIYSFVETIFKELAYRT